MKKFLKNLWLSIVKFSKTWGLSLIIGLTLAFISISYQNKAYVRGFKDGYLYVTDTINTILSDTKKDSVVSNVGFEITSDDKKNIDTIYYNIYIKDLILKKNKNDVK